MIKSLAIREFIIVPLITHRSNRLSRRCGEWILHGAQRDSTRPLTVTRWFSPHLSPVSCTHFHTLPRPRTRYRAMGIASASTRNKKGLAEVRCIITHVRERALQWPSLCQLPTFSTRNKARSTVVLLPSVHKAPRPGYQAARALSSYWSRSFVDYIYFANLSARLAFVSMFGDVIIILIIP